MPAARTLATTFWIAARRAAPSKGGPTKPPTGPFFTVSTGAAGGGAPCCTGLTGSFELGLEAGGADSAMTEAGPTVGETRDESPTVVS